MISKITCRVAGVSFADPSNDKRRKLRETADHLLTAIEGLPCVLLRNPANKFDHNAIEVHVTCLGDDGMLGHVPAKLARQFAPRIDRGERFTAQISAVYAVDGIDNFGVEIEIESVPDRVSS